MEIPGNEQLVNYLIILDKDGREFTTEEDNHWGGLILPAPGENPSKTGEGMKVVLFASWKFGFVALETLKKFEVQFPDRMNLVGLVTDNPLNPDAKISKKKRIWGMIDLPVQVVDETSMIEAGLSHGIPVYTGEIKIESFRKLLEQWNPDAIIVCVFGQLIDSFIINYPSYGIYNFHPSDLARHHGAGPRPYEDLKERNASTTVWTVHHVSEEIDSGHIVGQSPPVNVTDSQQKLPESQFIVWDKMTEALSPVVSSLAEELCNRFEKKEQGAIDHIDFVKQIPGEIRKKYLQPIVRDITDDLFPDPGSSVFTSI